jgi:type IV secretory pathway VirB2 component (pilin)
LEPNPVRKSVSLFHLSPVQRERAVRRLTVLAVLLFVPLAAHASPFDSGITSIQTLFTGTIAKAAALIAIVIGGLGFAFGDPGAKKNLAGVADGNCGDGCERPHVAVGQLRTSTQRTLTLSRTEAVYVREQSATKQRVQEPA